MATIVKVNDSDLHGILVGVGYGMFKSARPNMLFGDLLPSEKSGNSQMAALPRLKEKSFGVNRRDLRLFRSMERNRANI